MKGYILNGQDASYEYSIIFTITEKKEGFIDNFPIIFQNMSYVHIKKDISEESTQACKALLAGLTAPSLTVAPLSATYISSLKIRIDSCCWGLPLGHWALT